MASHLCPLPKNPDPAVYPIWLCVLTIFRTGCGQEPSAWEFTYRPRAGDSGRDVVDVVEDYLGHPVLPYGQNITLDPLYTSGDPADYHYIQPDTKHHPDCSSFEHNKKGLIKPKMIKKVPLKTESFYDLVTKSEIVHDRTLLMSDLFTKKFFKHIHLTRPVGWGKTVALDMFRRFLGLEVDEKGWALPEEKKVNRKLFEGGTLQIGNTTKVLPTLKIGNRELIVNKFGRIPIVFFSFKNVTGTSFQEVFSNLKRELVTLFRSQVQLFPVVKSRRFDRLEKQLYLKFFKNKTDRITVADVRNCCVVLVRATKHFYKARPIVMFDDFDMPLRSSYEHIFGNKDEVWSIFEMIDSMFESLVNDNQNVRKFITAGVLPFVRHQYRVLKTYMDFHLMRYHLDLYLGIRDPSTTQPPSREWTITNTPYYWPPTPNIDL